MKFIYEASIENFSKEINRLFKEGWRLVPNSLKIVEKDKYNCSYYIAVVEKGEAEGVALKFYDDAGTFLGTWKG